MADDELSGVARVQNSEKLYRGVKPKHWKPKRDGSGFYLSSQAFTDPDYRISVYRACLCGHNPRRAQKDRTYYVCSLLTERVRGIGSVVRMNNAEVVQRYTIDVEPKPLDEDEDDSHAEIFMAPDNFSPRIFERLQEALARPERYNWEEELGPP